MTYNFAILGVGGYVAPRHLKAIYETGNKLDVAFDPKDSVGIIDQYFLDAKFFNEYDAFVHYLEKIQSANNTQRVNYISICSPNYLHEQHCRLALQSGANAICEKPLVINPTDLDILQDLEGKYYKKIYTILQLRQHPNLIKLHDQLPRFPRQQHKVILTYVTSRGSWYDLSWKGFTEKSGGIAFNIGIHLFDLLLWIFGKFIDCKVYYSNAHKMSGFLELEYARVSWFLSIDYNDLPFCIVPGGKSAYRCLEIDGEEIEFTDGFTNLHTLVYKQTLENNGYGIEEARPSINLSHLIRNKPISKIDKLTHPMLARK